MGFFKINNLYILLMKYIKPINEFWNPFKKKEPLSFQQVEVMCTELVDIIYDIFDEYNIVDGNDDYYSGTEGDILVRNVEPNHDHWRYGVYGFNLSNPKDRIIIVANVDKSDKIYSQVEKMKNNIENQIGCKINIFYDLKKKSDRFDNIRRERGESGRIVISLLHGLKLKSHDSFGGYTGPR